MAPYSRPAGSAEAMRSAAAAHLLRVTRVTSKEEEGLRRPACLTRRVGTVSRRAGADLARNG